MDEPKTAAQRNAERRAEQRTQGERVRARLLAAAEAERDDAGRVWAAANDRLRAALAEVDRVRFRLPRHGDDADWILAREIGARSEATKHEVLAARALERWNSWDWEIERLGGRPLLYDAEDDGALDDNGALDDDAEDDCLRCSYGGCGNFLGLTDGRCYVHPHEAAP